MTLTLISEAFPAEKRGAAIGLWGGITGLAIARLATRNGYSVALLERGDLACGASSATSHMLHGGLRYLEHGHFALVREALRERAAVRRMAPDLTRPTRFLIPFYRGDRRPPWMVRLGLAGDRQPQQSESEEQPDGRGDVTASPVGLLPARLIPSRATMVKSHPRIYGDAWVSFG